MVAQKLTEPSCLRRRNRNRSVGKDPYVMYDVQHQRFRNQNMFPLWNLFNIFGSEINTDIEHAARSDNLPGCQTTFRKKL